MDCGGSCMTKCGDNKMCLIDGDCTSGNCYDDGLGNGLQCHADLCSDGIQDGNESGVDCGGTSTCGACGQGKTCGSGTDCMLGNCVDGFCCTRRATVSARRAAPR